VVKERVNAIALAPADELCRDSNRFVKLVKNPEAQGRIQAAMKRGFRTPDAELDLDRLLGELVDR